MNKLTIKGENPKSPWTLDQIELIKNTIAVGATNDELKLFLVQAQRTGLDPLTRQIFFIKRAGKVTIQTSIDGLRVVAQRSKDFAGQSEPEFTEDGNTTTKCVVRVYRWSPLGERYEAAVGVAYWNEYCPQQGQDFMWRKMPHTMLAKVAEALALRKAFPNDLSGVYSQEEMAQATPSDTSTAIRHEVTNGGKVNMTPDDYMELPPEDKDEIHEGVKANNRRRYAESKQDDIPVINVPDEQ